MTTHAVPPAVALTPADLFGVVTALLRVRAVAAAAPRPAVAARGLKGNCVPVAVVAAAH